MESVTKCQSGWGNLPVHRWRGSTPVVGRSTTTVIVPRAVIVPGSLVVSGSTTVVVAPVVVAAVVV
jgi:hypothetical protein